MHLSEIESILFSRRWHRVSFQLRNTRFLGADNQEPLVCAVNAIVKEVNSVFRKALPEWKEEADAVPNRVLFRIPGKKHDYYCTQGEELRIEVFLIVPDEALAEVWTNCLRSYLQEAGGQNRNFELASDPEIQLRSVSDLLLLRRYRYLQNSPEVCLDFITPLRPTGFRKYSKSAFLPPEALLQSLVHRLNFLYDLNLQLDWSDITVKSYLTLRKGVKHISSQSPSKQKKKEKNRQGEGADFAKSGTRQEDQAGDIEQELSGYRGRVFLSGNLEKILALLIIGSELGVGTSVSNAMGHFRLFPFPEPWLSKDFPKEEDLFRAVSYVMENSYPMDETVTTPEEILKAVRMALDPEQAYQPNSTHTWMIPKKDGSQRKVEHLHIVDTCIHRVLLNTLEPWVDRFSGPECLGIRKGYQPQNTSERICAEMQKGYHLVYRCDIKDFYDSVDHGLLLTRLKNILPLCDTLLLNHLKTTLQTPFFLDGQIMPRTQGLITGSPLSALLANVYLLDFDAEMRGQDIQYFRYADDLLFLARTQEALDLAIQSATNFLSRLHLILNTDKTFMGHIQQGFSYLGMHFQNAEGLLKSETESVTLRKPLYITEPYALLSYSDGAIELRKKGAILDSYPLERVGEIMILESCSLSTTLVHHCLKEGIPITMAYRDGKFMTCLKPQKKTYHDTLHLQGLKYYALTEREKLQIAQHIVARKIENHIPVFYLKYRNYKEPIFRLLKEGIESVYRSSTVEELRGIEGYTARVIYQAWGKFLPSGKGFDFKGRDRLMPDRINSLINFASHLLFNRINTTLRALGINPYLGFLHSPGDKYESLVCDIQELFRGRMLKMILRLINLGKIQEDDFTELPRGGYWLTPEARKTFVLEFEKEMNRISSRQRTSLKEEIYIQARQLKAWCVSSAPFQLNQWRV